MSKEDRVWACLFICLFTAFVCFVRGEIRSAWMDHDVFGAAIEKIVIDTPAADEEYAVRVRLNDGGSLFIPVSDIVYYDVELDKQYRFGCSHTCWKYGELEKISE